MSRGIYALVAICSVLLGCSSGTSTGGSSGNSVVGEWTHTSVVQAWTIERVLVLKKDGSHEWIARQTNGDQFVPGPCGWGTYTFENGVLTLSTTYEVLSIGLPPSTETKTETFQVEITGSSLRFDQKDVYEKYTSPLPTGWCG